MARTATPQPETATEKPAVDFSVLANSEEVEYTPQRAAVEVPEEVKKFVHSAHDAWKNAPKKWRAVPLAVGEAREEVVKLATRYAKSAGLTFRQNKKRSTDTHLHYKVTDAVHKNGTSSDDASTDADSES